MAKIRVKKRIYKDNKTVFVVQVKTFLFYKQIGHDGDSSFLFDGECDSLEEVKLRIEKFHKGNWRGKHKIKKETIINL